MRKPRLSGLCEKGERGPHTSGGVNVGNTVVVGPQGVSYLMEFDMLDSFSLVAILI